MQTTLTFLSFQDGAQVFLFFVPHLFATFSFYTSVCDCLSFGLSWPKSTRLLPAEICLSAKNHEVYIWSSAWADL